MASSLDGIKAAVSSCLCITTPLDHSDDEENQNQNNSQGGRHVFARDELEGLLASSDDDGGPAADTMSLHSNVGGGGGRRQRKSKKKKAVGWGVVGRNFSGNSRRSLQMFGWFPFGHPVGKGAIALSEDEDEGGGDGRERRISDAAPLDPESIARLAQQRQLFKENFEPERTSEDLAREECELAEQEERNAYVPPLQADTIDDPTPPLSETSTPTPASPTKYTDAERRIRKAARQQRRRLREEAERSHREAMESHADAAAGGFEFGDFVAPQPLEHAWTESISEGTSSHPSAALQESEGVPVRVRRVEEDDEEDESMGVDYGAEYAGRVKKAVRSVRGGSESDRMSAAGKVPLPPSTIGSGDAVPPAPPLVFPSPTRRSNTMPARKSSVLAKPPRTHRSQGSASTSSRSVDVFGSTHPRVMSPEAVEFDGVPGGMDFDEQDVLAAQGMSVEQEEEFDGTPGGLDRSFGGFGSTRRTREHTVDLGSPSPAPASTKFPSTGFGGRRPQRANTLSGAAGLARRD